MVAVHSVAPFAVACAVLLLAILWAFRWHFRVVEAPSLSLRGLTSVFASACVADSSQLLGATRIHGWLAWPLLAGSAALFVSALWATRRQRPSVACSGDEPTFLVRTGPYRFLRHPFYVSYSMFFGAVLVAVPTSVTGLVWAVVTWMYVSAARGEERKFARSSLAATYAAYAREVAGSGPWRSRRRRAE